MVMLFVMLFVLFVWFQTRDSSVVLIVHTFLRCYIVVHPGLYHTTETETSKGILYNNIIEKNITGINVFIILLLLFVLLITIT